MTIARQLRLDLRRERCFRRENFIVSSSNADAVAALDAWPNWPNGQLALVGPEGCGKTHLARAWADRVDAAVFPLESSTMAGLGRRPILFENADQRQSDEALFHFANHAQAGGSLMVTGRTPPRTWKSVLPDLRSRLNAMTVATIGAPDDIVLESVLSKLFRELNIKPAEGVVAYLVRRIERSVPAAIDIVARIDEVADAESRNITRALARRIVEGEDRTIDLFE